MARKPGTTLLTNNRRGSLLDMAYIIGVIVVFAVSILIGFKIWTSFNDSIQTNSNIPASAKSVSTRLGHQYTGVMDNMFMMAFVFLAIGSLILAAMVRIHPIFIPIYLIVLTFMIFMGAIGSNIYTSMASNDALIAEASQLTMTNNILMYLPFFVGIIGLILMIVSYKTWQDAQ